MNISKGNIVPRVVALKKSTLFLFSEFYPMLYSLEIAINYSSGLSPRRSFPVPPCGNESQRYGDGLPQLFAG
jgi:hypothetical protein